MPTLTNTVLMGGADAFIQGIMQTGLEGVTKQAYRIDELSFEIILPTPGYPLAGAAASLRWELCISRRSKAAMPMISDVDVIKKFSYSNSIMTAVGSGGIFPSVQQWQPRDGQDLIVVEPNLYVQMKSLNTTQTFSAIMRMDYTIVNISEIDRLTLLTQSLQ